LYDQGSAQRIEDGIVVQPPFFGIIDCTSPPYWQFERRSDGEVIRKIIMITFFEMLPEFPLEDAILKINQRIDQFYIKNRVSSRPDLRGAAAFVFVKVEEEETEIIQGADCIAIWQLSSGKIDCTENQAYSHELEAHYTIIPRLLKKHCENKKAMWKEFTPILKKLRCRDYNSKRKTGFAMLNGDPRVKECWQRISLKTERVKNLLLFSDGALPFVPPSEQKRLARRVISMYKRKGLGKILEMTRKLQKKRREQSHIDFPEASLLALSF
jgi:hypothetical protein